MYLVQDPQVETGGESVVDSEITKRLVLQLRDMIRSGVTEDCSICLDDLKVPVITPCGHVYCRACIERVLDNATPACCPLCRKEMTKMELLA